MGKSYLLHLFFAIDLVTAFSVHGQHEDDKRFYHPQYDDVKIYAPKQKIVPGISITGIYVYDCRPDTTTVGLLYSTRPEAVLLKIKGSLTAEIKHFYELLMEQPVSPLAWGELHCFIKKLSLSDLITVPLATSDDRAASGKFDNTEESGVKIKIEFYFRKGNDFIPAYRFDSLWTGSKGISAEGGRYIANALAASLKKTSTLNWERLLADGKRLSWKEINDFNMQVYQYPILTSAPQKGVFVSFEDFRNNKVSYSNFTVNRDNKGDFLYLKNDAGQETLLTDLWGYSDGKDVYIYSANNFFKLYRTGNSLMFYGAKDYTRRRVMRLNFRLIDLASPNSTFSKGRTSARYKLEKDYLQVDWDTGEIY